MLTRRAAIALTLLASLGMAGCGLNQGAGGAADLGKPLTIIADAEPHTTLLKQVQKDGLLGDVKIQVREIAGGIDPNQLVASGDVDLNFFQHTPYLKNWNAEHKTNLVNAGGIHIEPLGLYSKKVTKVDEVPQNANIAIPADPTNQARALFLLADAGIFTMDVKATDPGLDFAKITEKNIKDNPKQVTFTKIDRPQLFASLSDPKITLSVVNGNYALEGGLNPSKDALVLEKAAENPYVNILVTRSELEKDARVVKLAQALRDAKVKSFIETTYKGSVLPAQG